MAVAGKPPKSKKPVDPADLPDVELHDEVYFRHAAGPKTGRVLARGQHGCTIEADGTRHKVKWESFLGHKVRVRPDVKVVDQGKDGMIVEDPHGRRRYVHDPVDETPPPLTKSLLPPVLFFAGREELMKAIANRPGLSLQETTDRTGKRTKRWKRTQKPVPKIHVKAAAEHTDPRKKKAAEPEAHAEGAAVEFAGGPGKVVGDPGKDGAHVQDETGKIHKVAWGDMKAAAAGGGKGGGDEPPHRPDYEPREEGEEDKAYAKRVVDKTEGPKSLPDDPEHYFNTDGATMIDIDKLISAKTDEENKQGGDNGPKRMLAAYHGALGKRDPIMATPNGDGTYTVVDGNGTLTSAKAMGFKGLPVWVVQPTADREELFAKSVPALEEFATWLNKGSGFCDKLGYTTQTKGPDQMTEEDWNTPGGKLFIAPIKKASRSEEKVEKEYDGVWSRLVDTVRGMIVVDTLEEMHELRGRLAKEGMLVLAKPEKDRFKKPTREGYRDVMMNIRFPNGIIGELQVNVAEMAKAKELIGHPLYEISRTIAAKYPPQTDSTDFSEKDNKEFWEAVDAQKAAYAAAWEKISSKPAK